MPEEKKELFVPRKPSTPTEKLTDKVVGELEKRAELAEKHDRPGRKKQDYSMLLPAMKVMRAKEYTAKGIQLWLEQNGVTVPYHKVQYLVRQADLLLKGDEVD
jgi:hypothetical protein